ncbi:MAG TPA: ABC transporter ATP-binding protein [Isosphaeraceae bacterium]|nr:ABC transporter ATP-binding protein [Isosphaeraceae bacterium]
MPTPVAEFVDVTKTYPSTWRPGRGVQALRGVSFAVEPGEVFALLGPNRAGKTTLLKILLGLCRPSGGRAFRMGCPVSERSTLARVGYMHENQGFPRYLTAASLLKFAGTLASIQPAVLRPRVPALLEMVGLSDRAREPIAHYSKGMVQRLALAHALLAEPDLLVLDEPAEGLDWAARGLLREIIAAHRRAGKTVLVVSHALAELTPACDRLAVLVEGRLAYCGPLAAILRDPDTGRQRSLEAALAPICRP